MGSSYIFKHLKKGETYYVYMKNNDGGDSIIHEGKTIASRTYKIKKLKKGKTYFIRVRGVNGKELSFELLDAGYVLIYANIPVCIKMDDQVFFDVFSMLS